MPNNTELNHFSINPVGIATQRSIQNLNHSVKFSGHHKLYYPLQE